MYRIPFLGHCDLNLCPIVSRIIVSGAYLLYYLCRNPKFGVLIPLGMAELCIPFWVTFTLTLTSGLISRFFVSGAYLHG